RLGIPFTTGISAQSGITTLSGKKCLDLWGQIQSMGLDVARLAYLHTLFPLYAPFTVTADVKMTH
uniref:hypothetical protein n=1 Tax=Aeromonas allosaccharophila TaxID=656 RepID=UPI002B466AD0